MSQVYVAYYFKDSEESGYSMIRFYGVYESMKEAIEVVKKEAQEAYDDHMLDHLIELKNEGKVNSDLEIHMSEKEEIYVFKFRGGRENYCVNKSKFHTK